MTITRHAQTFAQELAERRVVEQKNEYRTKLLKLQQAFQPPLTNAELAAGLELKAPAEGKTGYSDVGRFVSTSPRLRRARPDGATRALIDAVLEGDLFIAVQSAVPGARRPVLFCDARDAKRLARHWRVRNLGGGEIPERIGEEPVDWDDGELWDMFGDQTTKPRGPNPRASIQSVAIGDVHESPLGHLVPRRPLAGRSIAPIGLGAMRLSTVDRPDDSDALAILQGAIELGVGVIDTADSYCLDDTEVGHNERLIRQALDGRSNPPLVATKAGLIRPGGRWLPDGRPEHLRASCENSLRNLGVDCLDLFQFHAPDRKTPFADSVGMLSELQKEGKIRHIGLCNVDLPKLEEASAIATIASVQNPCSFFDSAALKKGLLSHCLQNGIDFIAHSPLGGHRRAQRADKDQALQSVAKRHGASPRQVALAWLLHMAPGIIAIPGATRLDSVRSSVAASRLHLDDEDFQLLDTGKRSWTTEVRQQLWALGPSPEPEVVLVMGAPAAGKTSRVQPYVDRGYQRLNRDLAGGKLDDLVTTMAASVAGGQRSFVLDNTYPTSKSRQAVLQLAKSQKIPAVGILIDIPLEEALYNACLRMLSKHGRILSPKELKELSRVDPNMLPPAAIYHYYQSFQEPKASEGFGQIDTVSFERRIAADMTRKALILDYDGTLRRSTGPAPFPLKPEEVEILPRRIEVLDRYVKNGYLLLGVSNQSAIGRGQLTEPDARACFDRTNELLGHDIEVLFSPDAAESAGVWSRKPMPGLGVELIERHRLDRSQCLYVGDMDSDRGFAHNCGFEYRDANEFFAAKS